LENTEAQVTPLIEAEFWLKVSESSLNPIWANPDNDVYAGLLEE